MSSIWTVPLNSVNLSCIQRDPGQPEQLVDEDGRARRPALWQQSRNDSGGSGVSSSQQVDNRREAL
jgi:hypothetical protein